MRRPQSEVTGAIGLVGAASLAGLTILAMATDMPVGPAMALLLAGTALPMVVWSLAVDKVHRRTTTGLDFTLRRPPREVAALTVTKTMGLGATLLLVGAAYLIFRIYAREDYQLFRTIFFAAALPLLVFGIPYIAVASRHMVEPRDGLWHFGKLVCLDLDSVDFEKVKEHLRGWAIKAFFLAYILAIFPGFLAGILLFDVHGAANSPVATIIFLIRLTFLFDICFGTIGYMLTFRLLDSHIRSANPHLGAWVAALLCYPPFAIMGSGGPLDYRVGTQEWNAWFTGHDGILLIWGLIILGLAFVYAWSTVVFGIRFSNLTHRGIVTDGPYRFLKHPAYLSKNVMWWLAHLPFLTTGHPGEAVRNCVLLLAVNAVYYLRAKTEERHLMADPHYRAYTKWIARHGVLERLFANPPSFPGRARAAARGRES